MTREKKYKSVIFNDNDNCQTMQEFQFRACVYQYVLYWKHFQERISEP